MVGFSVKSKGRSFIRGKSIDDSPRGSIVDWIIAEGGYPASGYFGGQFKEVVELVEVRASIKIPGGYSPKFRIGVCRERSQTLTLSKDKENEN